MRILTIIILSLLIISPLSAQSSLDEYLKYAAENSPKLKAKFYSYMSSVQKTAQVSELPDPQIAFGYFISPVETRVGAQNFKISLKQRFPWFGKLQSKSDISLANAKTKYQEFESEKYKLYFEIKKEWYSIYLFSKEVDFIKKQVEFFASLKNITEAKYQNSLVSLDEFVRVQQKLLDLEDSQQELQKRLEAKKAAFNSLLGKDAESDVSISDNIELPSFDPVMLAKDSVLINNSDLLALELERQTTQRMIESSKLDAYPDISLSLDYTNVTDRPDIDIPDNGKDVFMPMLSISIPLFKDKYDAKTEEYEFQSRMIDEKILDYKNRIKSDLARIREEYNSAIRSTRLAEEKIRFAKQSSDLIIAEYTASGNKFSELILQKEKILKFEFQLESAKVKANIAYAMLLLLNSKM